MEPLQICAFNAAVAGAATAPLGSNVQEDFERVHGFLQRALTPAQFYRHKPKHSSSSVAHDGRQEDADADAVGNV